VYQLKNIVEIGAENIQIGNWLMSIELLFNNKQLTYLFDFYGLLLKNKLKVK
jgi:hypothetical protein